MLADSFSKQADAIIAADHPAPNKSWSEKVWSTVMNVSVRPIKNLIANGSDARVARAQVDLNLGELPRAIHEVSALTGPAREAAESWLKSANERMTVDRDARTLAQRLVANLSAQPNASQIPAAAASPR
jgi:hypothetical protein